jgi:hypothetical protein
VSRERILSEIQRTAEANGGRPLGIERFTAETGITERDWRGRYWVRWSEAVQEAGYQPNAFNNRYDDDQVIERLIAEIRRLGRMPVEAEIVLARRNDPSFPSHNVFRRIGPKKALTRAVISYCELRDDHQDVIEMLAPAVAAAVPEEAAPVTPTDEGFVYLIKSGRFYKIGWTRDVGRRSYDLKLQLPDPATQIHVIATDDPIGIERYWHRRFADRHKNGEWFELAKADVAAFKRRKFM